MSWKSAFVTFCTFLVCSCHLAKKSSNVVQNQSKEEIIAIKENHKYSLIAVFYGELLRREPDGKGEAIIMRLTFRSRKTGKEVTYIPDDPAVKDSLGYFRDIWSPDDEYTVLLRGRFKGFCIIKSKDLLARIASKTCSDFMQVSLAPDNMVVWHEFDKWISNSSFAFEVGLSGKNSRFTYDIIDQQLTVIDSQSRFFHGINSRGPIPIRSR